MTRYKLMILIALAVLLVLAPTSCTQNGIPITPTESSNQELSTPALIEQAFANGEITDEERLLYLAYAIFEYESLPTQFRSNIGWRGTSILEDLEEAANSPSVLCSMSPDVRSEFQRLLNSDTFCE